MNTSICWQVESLRFTLFTPVDVKPASSSLWEKITGIPPNNRIEQPLLGVLVEEGSWNDRKLSVTVQLGRIDVVVTQNSMIMSELPSIGTIEDNFPMFRELLLRLDFNHVNRIALGVALLHAEVDVSSAYNTLRLLLPKLGIPLESRDFLYQINVPIQSKIESAIEINRVQHWSAISMHIFNLLIQSNVQLFAVRLVLDISTSQDKMLSNSQNIPKLIDELIDEAIAMNQGKNL